MLFDNFYGASSFKGSMPSPDNMFKRPASTMPGQPGQQGIY